MKTTHAGTAGQENTLDLQVEGVESGQSNL
jgi:hypothetical protein